MIDATAAAGFGRQAAAGYDAGRAPYPTALTEEGLSVAAHLWAQPAAGGRWPAQPIVELGPGTGKFTSALEALIGSRGTPNLVLVEPAGMGDVLAERFPHARILRTTAADMSELGTGSASAVTGANCFHWFGNEASIREVHRVLAPGGDLLVVFFGPDGLEPWYTGLQTRLYEAAMGSPIPPERTQGVQDWPWRGIVEKFFGPLSVRRFSVPNDGVTLEGLKMLARSASFVAKLPAEEQERIMAIVEEYFNAPSAPVVASSAGEPRKVKLERQLLVLHAVKAAAV